MGLQEFYTNLNNQMKAEFQRCKTARLAIEKLNTLKLMVGCTDELEAIRQREFKATLGCVGATFAFSFVATKRWFGRYVIVGLGMLGVKMIVRPHYLAEMMETIAEKPTEAGQTVRAVYLFKMPTHPKFSHFDKLSSEYRLYLSKSS